MSIKITSYKSVEVEVEVDLTLEDIAQALPSSLDELDSEGLPYRVDLISGLTSIYCFITALKPEYFSVLKPAARKLLAKHFRELANKVEGVETHEA